MTGIGTGIGIAGLPIGLIPGATFERVQAFFVCEPRGRIPAKGKGELDMYLLKSIRPELSDDGATPNARFHTLYQALGS